MRENKMDIDVKKGEIIRCFLEEGMEKTLENYKESLPHENLLRDIIKSHYDFKKKGKKGKTDLEHFEDVVRAMNNLLNNKAREVIDLSGSRNSIAQDSKGHKKNLKTIIENKNLKEDKDLLLYTALYHDIGKAIIRPRHGPEGADIIKDSGLKDRKKFYDLGFKRPDFFFMSDLIRFHDYLAMVGTGEVSYLIFAEVLSPISNLSLFSAEYAERFLDYLLLLNLADIAGSIEGKVSSEDFTVLMHDFKVIKSAHDNISKKVYGDIFKEKPPHDKIMSEVHKETIPARDYIDILSELQRLAENHTSERLRRLLRIGFKDLIKQDEKIKGSSEYKKWIENKYSLEGYLKPPDKWFIRDYENGINDMIPIIASLRGINVKQEFYTRFAFICKLDYMLGFICDLFGKVIEIEIKKKEEERKSPHDLRRDLAMTLVGLINTLVELFGDFTSNNTKIGLGFERFKEMHDPQKGKMLERLTGEAGNFKEAEALTKLRNSVVLWVIAP